VSERCFAILNAISTYPTLKVGAYSTARAKEILRDFGAAGIDEGIREEDFAYSVRALQTTTRVVRREVSFYLPDASLPMKHRLGELAAQALFKKYSIPRNYENHTAGSLIEYQVMKEFSGNGPSPRIHPWHPRGFEIYTALAKIGKAYPQFDFQVEDHGLEFSTRDSGDVGSEAAGEADVRAAQKLVSAIKAQLPDVEPALDIVDEWVSVTVPFSGMGESDLEDERQAYPRAA